MNSGHVYEERTYKGIIRKRPAEHSPQKKDFKRISIDQLNNLSKAVRTEDKQPTIPFKQVDYDP